MNTHEKQVVNPENEDYEEAQEFDALVVGPLSRARWHVNWLVVVRKRRTLRPLEIVLHAAHDLAVMTRGSLRRGEA